MKKRSRKFEGIHASTIKKYKKVSFPFIYSFLVLFLEQDLSIFKKNILKLKEKIKSIKKTENFDFYQCLSCILGAFLGDSLGSFCEFSKYSPLNFKRIFKGYNVFGCQPGQLTDDSEMALSMTYALMDMPNKDKLDQNILYYYYGLWCKSHPIDIGNTTTRALKHFEFDSYFINDSSLFTKPKLIIKLVNIFSISDGFLMRISPLVAWYYYRNKEKIKVALSSKNSKQYYELYSNIKEESKKDNEETHSNPEVYTASALFIFIALCAISGYTANEVLEKLNLLLESFGWFTESTLKNFVKHHLESFSSRNFNKEEFFKSVSESRIGNYDKGFKLTLYYLYFFDSIKEEKTEMGEYSKYRVIMNEICNCGGDTDTNAAIVGTVIGPLIGLNNFGKDLDILLEYVPRERFFYSTSLIYYYMKYLEDSNKETEQGTTIRFNYYRNIMKTLLIKTE